MRPKLPEADWAHYVTVIRWLLSVLGDEGTLPAQQVAELWQAVSAFAK